MKTIKELETIEGKKPSPKWDSQNIGYHKALRDVLGLIDEHINSKGTILKESLKELKKRITG